MCTTTRSKFCALHLNLSRSSNFGFDCKSIVMSSVTFTKNSYFKLFLREIIFLPYVLFRCCSISIGPLSKLNNLNYDKNAVSVGSQVQISGFNNHLFFYLIPE